LNDGGIEGSLAAGASDQGPYDVILLQGGAETVPVTVTDQLKDGGRIAVVFMEGVLGVCRIGLSRGGKVTWRDAFNASAPVLPGFEMTRAFAL
ncbi:MAG: protein-L-isoaspartate O-methyltransferase, partial [Pseudomonadota bacterium]